MAVSPSPLFVIGHKNPDTDAICSAVGYSELLRRTREPEALAACCGVINARTRWVLMQGEVDPPPLVMDVRPTAASICQREVVKANARDTFLDVYRVLAEHGLRSLPIVNDANHVVGVPTQADILALLVPGRSHQALGDRLVFCSLESVRSVIGATVECGECTHQEEEMVIMVAASSLENIERSLGNLPTNHVLVLVGDRPDVHDLVVESGVRGVILTGGYAYDPVLTEKARAKGVALLRCGRDTASTGGLIRCSRQISGALSEAFITLRSNQRIPEILGRIQDTSQPLFPVVCNETDELIGVISKSDLLNPPRTRLVLVDHNEFSQAVTGADEAEILEVLDHHRLSGNLVSREPLRFINEPLGSTSTIVGRMFQQHGLMPSKGTAMCLCAGIISDTLKLSSPTTTEVDRIVLPWLAAVAQVDLESFARSFFEAGSVLNELSPNEVLGVDRKEYLEAGWRISIAQIEELGLESYPEKEEALLTALAAHRAESKLDFACLLVTDITKHSSILLVDGADAVIDAIDYPRQSRHVFLMEGVVSRKKQFFPYLSNRLAKICPLK